MDTHPSVCDMNRNSSSSVRLIDQRDVQYRCLPSTWRFIVMPELRQISESYELVCSSIEVSLMVLQNGLIDRTKFFLNHVPNRVEMLVIPR
jgi:hypothetical protein